MHVRGSIASSGRWTTASFQVWLTLVARKSCGHLQPLHKEWSTPALEGLMPRLISGLKFARDHLFCRAVLVRALVVAAWVDTVSNNLFPIFAPLHACKTRCML